MQIDVRALRSEDDDDWALRASEPYFENQPEHGTPEAARFDGLANLLQVYGDEIQPIESQDPSSHCGHQVTRF